MEKCHRRAFSHFEMPCYRLSAQPDERDGCKPAEGWFVRGSLVIAVPSTRPSWPSQPKLDQVGNEPKKNLKSGDLIVT